MAKLTTANLTSLTNETSAVSTINSNFALVEDALQATLSRDGTSPNEMEADLDLNSRNILNVNSINVETITLDGYVITKDSFGAITAISVSEGTWKENCVTATSGPITLSGEQTINDVLTSSSRVLVKNQADGTTNGIYVSAVGAWARAEDCDSTADIEEGALVYIEGDATGVGDKVYILSTAGGLILGTSILSFSPITTPVRYSTFKLISGTEYTLTATDRGKMLLYEGSLDCFITLPANDEVRIGTSSEVEFLLAGTGTITFVAGTGATIRTPFTESMTRQWSVAKAKKRGQTTWILSGEIAQVGAFGKDILETADADAAIALFSGNLEDLHNLADPNGDRGLFWDDSVGEVSYFTFGTGFSISGANISVDFGWADISGDPTDNAAFVAHTHDDRYYTQAEVDSLFSGGGATWGAITGTLSAQTDLQTALDAKADDLGADDNYVTDAEKVKLSNLSGTNSGDQTTIVGITGTKAQFDTAVTDGNIVYTDAIGVSVQGYDADTAAIAALSPSNDDIIQRKAGAWTNRTIAQLVSDIGTTVNSVQSFVIACSDEATALTTGTAKVTFRMPYAFTVSAVRASVTTAPTGGTLLTVDINEAGASILSTKLTFDASEKTTTTAATPAVISDTSLADDAEITIDIDAVGSTIAGAGLKVYIIGTRT